MGRKNKGYSGKKNPFLGQNIPPITVGWLKYRITALPSMMHQEREMGMGSENKQNHEECRKKEPRKKWGSSSEVTKHSHKLERFVGVCV